MTSPERCVHRRRMRRLLRSGHFLQAEESHLRNARQRRERRQRHRSELVELSIRIGPEYFLEEGTGSEPSVV